MTKRRKEYPEQRRRRVARERAEATGRILACVQPSPSLWIEWVPQSMYRPGRSFLAVHDIVRAAFHLRGHE